MYKKDDKNVGINFSFYIKDDSYFTDLILNKCQPIRYRKRILDDYSVIFEFSPTDYYTYSALAWETFEYINIEDHCLVYYLKNMFKSSEDRENALKDIINKLLDGQRICFHQKESETDKFGLTFLTKEDLFLVWIRLDKSSEIKDLTFDYFWSEEELDRLDISRGVLYKCKVCSKYTRAFSIPLQEHICSIGCMNKYLKEHNISPMEGTDSVKGWTE